MLLPRLSRIVLLACAVARFASPARADPLYNATALTAPGNLQPIVEGLNNNSQVLLSNYRAPAGAPLYSVYNGQAGGTITPLVMNDASQTTALIPQSFNDNGQMVVWTGGRWAVSSGGQLTMFAGWGAAINDSGQVAYVGNNGMNVNSYIMTNGSVTNMGTVPGYENTTVVALNNSGQAAATGVHSLGVAQYQSQPLFYNGQTVIPLGTFGGSYGLALGINNKGDVIGTATNAAGNDVGFVSHNGGPLTSLGTLPGSVESQPHAINDGGQLVGVAFGLPVAVAPTATEYAGGAFLYQDGTLTDLNKLLSPSASNITLVDAYAINNAGQIVAEGFLKGEDKPQLFLLTPQGQPIPLSPDPLIVSTPEPSTLAIFGLMLAGMVAHRWRRQAVPLTASASR